MKKFFILCLLCVSAAMPAAAQFDLGRAIKGGVKAAQALTLSDEQMAQYVAQTIAHMDSANTVAPDNSPYTIRLKKLTQGITNADGIPLNYKVYMTSDVNAFACPDGSVRVYSGLMDVMNDDELLGVVGHEIGHVVKRHSKNAFKDQLLRGALMDGLSAASSTVARLNDSQLGQLGEAFLQAKFSKKQEKQADDCGYDFLVANGRNPWGMVMAFEKLQAMERDQASGNFVTKMFSDHPDTPSRIKAMTKRCNKDGYNRPAENSSPDQASYNAQTQSTKKSGTTKSKTTKKKSTKKTSKKKKK